MRTDLHKGRQLKPGVHNNVGKGVKEKSGGEIRVMESLGELQNESDTFSEDRSTGGGVVASKEGET